MTLKEFLNRIIVQTKDFDVTVYEVLTVLLILLFTYVFIRILRRIIQRREKSKLFDPGRSHAILQIIKYILWITAILISLQTFGIKLTLLLAGSAAILVGLGLGLQQIFQDIMSGIAILFEGTLKVGDIVEIQDDIVGRVVEIGLRTSKIETRDNIIMIVPNSKFVTDIVINWSHMEKRTRFHINVGVAYGSDVEQVLQILEQIGHNSEGLCKDPAPRARFRSFGASSLDFELLAWISEPSLRGLRVHEMNCEIYRRFAEEKVTIPFPQQDVWIRELPSSDSNEPSSTQ